MSPLERAKSAVWTEFSRPPEPTEDLDARCERAARAMLGAIREPSEAMLSKKTLFAGFVHDSDGLEDNLYHDREEAKQIWQAMIDAALSE